MKSAGSVAGLQTTNRRRVRKMADQSIPVPSEAFEYQDGLTQGVVRGRGAGLNPGNRFEDVRLHVLGEHLDQVAIETGGTAGQVATQVFLDHTRKAINSVDSPDIGFNWSINPYRGCEHGVYLLLRSPVS